MPNEPFSEESFAKALADARANQAPMPDPTRARIAALTVTSLAAVAAYGFWRTKG